MATAGAAGSLQGTAGIVTGAGSGIGRAIALAMAAEGARVAIAEIDEQAGEATARLVAKAGGEAFAVRTDVRDEAQVEAMVKATLDRFGRLDWACNNAATGEGLVPLTQLTRKEWDSYVEVALVGVWLCMKHEIPALVERGGGAIVNVGSMVGLNGQPLMSAYAAAKGGVIALSKSAAAEFAPMQVRVNVVNPGMIATPGNEEVAKLLPDFMERGIAAHALGRMGKPEEIAATVAFLCSEGAGFITGQCINVEGGVSVKATTYP